VTLGEKKLRLAEYLDDLLFPVPMQRQKVSALSGGERNRLLLAKLFLEGANVLVLDEPTNDLDLVTLTVLERLLVEFTGSVLLVTHDRAFLDKVATSLLVFEGGGRVVRYEGTLLLVSHDREFLDNVVTSTLVLEGDGRVGEYIGGYSDWLRQRVPETASAPRAARESAEPVVAATPAQAKRKLSYKDARELDALPARIEKLEAEIAALGASMAEPAFYQQDAAAITRANARLAELQTEHEAAFARWMALEGSG